MADLTTSIATAIQTQEGWYPGSATYNNNNPGALMNPATGTLQSYPDYQTGWNALLNQVNLNISRGLNLNEFFGGVAGGYPGYAPAAAGNDPMTYANNVAAAVGIDTTTPLNQLSSSSNSTIPGASTQPLVDLSGDAASTPTSAIMSQLENSTGIDLTDPTTDLILLAVAGAAAFMFAASR